MIKWLCAMMFVTTAFMAAAQAQSSYSTPCARDVNKNLSGAPDRVAMAMCNICEDRRA
jgi:hypothetical protein